MTKQDLIRKLSSRKFWALLAGLLTAALVTVGLADNQIAQIIGVVGAFGSIVVYVLGESYVDGQAASTGTTTTVTSGYSVVDVSKIDPPADTNVTTN